MFRCAATACRRTAPARPRSRPSAPGGRRGPHAARTASPVPSGGSWTTLGRRDRRATLPFAADHDDGRRRDSGRSASRWRSSAGRRSDAAPWAARISSACPAGGEDDGGKRRLAHRQLEIRERRHERRYSCTPPPLPTHRLLRNISPPRKVAGMQGFLLVFDLDGTLVDSVPDLSTALNEVLRERGRPAFRPRR